MDLFHVLYPLICIGFVLLLFIVHLTPRSTVYVPEYDVTLVMSHIVGIQKLGLGIRILTTRQDFDVNTLPKELQYRFDCDANGDRHET